VESLVENSGVAWIVGDSRPGHEKQALALCAAAGLAGRLLRPRLTPHLPARLVPGALVRRRLAEVAPTCGPPPVAVIGCGRRTAAFVAGARGWPDPRTIAVQIQKPPLPPDRFDLVIAPQHDRLGGANVLRTLGALAAPPRLPADSESERSLAILLVGELSTAAAEPLAVRLLESVPEPWCIFAVGSRRTPRPSFERLCRTLAPRLAAASPWGGQGGPALDELMGRGALFLVGGDSVSMTSEAMATGQPVYSLDWLARTRRQREFLANAAAYGALRPLTGRAVRFTPRSPDDLVRAAKALRHCLSHARNAGQP